MNAKSSFLKQASARHLIWGSLIGGIVLLSACASAGNNVSGFDELHLTPGDTGTCDSSPCRVFLRIPARRLFWVHSTKRGHGDYRARSVSVTVPRREMA